jgi:polyhydroxybutyrate depolymerase
MKPSMIALGLMLVCGSALAAAPSSQPSKPIAFDTHTGYFVSNKFEAKAGASFLVIRDQQAFDNVFGAAFVMGDKSHRLPAGAFDTKMVLAIIKRGKATWDYAVKAVRVEEAVLAIDYTATAKPQESAEFACPLIVSVPKGDYAAIEFVENGKSAKKIEAVGKGPSSRPATGDQLRRIEVGGRNRSYLVHLPPKHDPKKPAPVVLIFHGAATNASMMASFCGMNKKADEAGFVAVYPNGTGLGELLLTFNTWDSLAKNKPDDVAFTAKLLDDLARTIAVDPNRVYATGMSNGGMMCYRLAAELSDRLAAIAPVAGTLAIEKCGPKRPVPVMHFHGTADTIVPFKGPNQQMPKFLKFKSVEDTVQTWVKLNGCPEKPKTADLPDVAKDGTTVTRKTYGPGRDGAEVVLYAIEGGGHTWPGQEPLVGFIGKSTKNINANDLIWEFFQRHPMPAAASRAASSPKAEGVMVVVGRNRVWCLTFSPDGKLLAWGGEGSVVSIGEAASDGRLLALEGHGRTVRGVAFAPDSKVAATGGYEGTVRFWDAATGKRLLEFGSDGGGLRSLAFLPDGQTLATGDNDGVVRLWEVKTGKLARKLEGHKDAIRSIAISADGNSLVSGSSDGAIRLWNPKTGDLLREIKTPTRAVRSVAISPDAKLIVSSGYENAVRLWEAANGRELHALSGHGSHVLCVGFSPDGRLLATGSYDGTAGVWDVATRQVIARHNAKGNVFAVAFSPDGKMLATGGDGGVQRWPVIPPTTKASSRTD